MKNKSDVGEIVLTQMLENYYSGPYQHGDRNKSFVEVKTKRGSVFVSIHGIATIERGKDGNGVLVDRHNRRVKSVTPFLELAMTFELATKRVEKKPDPLGRTGDPASTVLCRIKAILKSHPAVRPAAYEKGYDEALRNVVKWLEEEMQR